MKRSIAVLLAAGLAIGIAFSLILYFGLLQPQISPTNEISQREIIAQYMSSEQMNNCSVSLLEASGNMTACRGPGSLVAVHIPEGSRELTIKEGSSATVNVMLVHAANAEDYPKLTVVLGSNKSMSSEFRLSSGTSIFPADYMYYGDIGATNAASALEKEKTMVLKANETKMVAVTIEMPQSFPDEVLNTKHGFAILFDIPEKSQIDNSYFGGIAARNNNIIVTVVK